MEIYSIKEILRKNDLFNLNINCSGWVRSKRIGKNTGFIALNDGSTIDHIQLVFDYEALQKESKDGEEILSVLNEIGIGAALRVEGTVVASLGKGQEKEIRVKKLQVLGNSNSSEYPIQPKKHNFEFLRKMGHLRFRTKTMGAILRIRHQLTISIHNFFDEQGFLCLHSPIITALDAEGAGDMFQVSTVIQKKEEKNTDVYHNGVKYMDVAELEEEAEKKKENYKKAESEFDKAITDDPKNREAYFKRGFVKDELGLLAKGMGEDEEAKNYFERALTAWNQVITDKPKYAEAFNNRGLTKHHLGNYHDAIQDFDKAIELKPNLAYAYFNITVTYLELGKQEKEAEKKEEYYKKAESEFEKGIRLDKDFTGADLLGGVIKNYLGKYEEAIKDFNKAIASDPKNASLYKNRGLVKYNLGNYHDAIQDFDKAIELDPKDKEAYNSRGITKRKLEYYKESIKDFNTSMELDPEDKETHHNISISKAQSGDYTGALESSKKAEPKDKIGYYRRGISKAQAGDYQGAIKDFNKAIELDEYFKDAYFSRGVLQHRFGNYQYAIKNYNKAIELDPKFKQAYIDRGLLHYRLRNYKEALQDYNKAIELDENLKEAYNNRGLLHDSLGKSEEALQDYNKAIELDENFKEAYNNRGLLYRTLGKYEEANTEKKEKYYQDAIADFDKAIELDPKYTIALNNRGLMKYFLGKNEEAIKDYDKAIELDENFKEAYLNRGLLQQILGKNEEAKEDYNKAIELDPKYKEAYLNRGLLQQILGKYEEAKEDFNKAITLDPKFKEAYNNRGAVKIKLGDEETNTEKKEKYYQEAIKDFDKVIELDPNYKKAYLNRGIVKKKLERYEEAQEDFDKAKKLKEHNISTVTTITTINENKEIPASPPAEDIPFVKIKDNLGRKYGKEFLDGSTDFFGKKASLTVSGQLEAEIVALSLGKVYTFGPTFRAEKSNTTRHLAEFWMVEPEMAFADLQDNFNIAQKLLNHCIKNILHKCPKDLAFLDEEKKKEEEKLPQNQRSKMGLIEQLKFVTKTPYKYITYTKAIDIITHSKKYKKKKFERLIKWGDDLQTEHERYLVEEHFQHPIAVVDYPKEIKAFYMKLNQDNKTVAAMDILFPGIGEMVGGSQREENLEKLEKRMEEMNIDKKELWWYLELRKFGSAPHSGFGLGFERLLQFITGMKNIREVIPFPRNLKEIEF